MNGWGKDVGDSLTLGFELVLPTLFCALVGYFVDTKLSSFPIGLIIGVFAGAAAGFWNVVKRYILTPEKPEKKEKD